MGKDSPPTQLDAEYYRRKNLSMADGPKPPSGGVGVETQPPTPPPNSSTTGASSATARPSPPPPPAHAPRPQHGLARRFGSGVMRVAGRTLKFGGAVVGIYAALSAAAYYSESKQVDDFFSAAVSDDDDDEDEKDSAKKPKKRVLVLPFDNLKVIEQRKPGDIDLRRFANRTRQQTITIEARELVDAIHAAASDPNVSALYADFGEGMRYPMGYAHIEEIRNAVRIFNESHRVHRDPNIEHNPVFAMMRNGDPKPSYAFGHSFSWNEYFLASAFSYVHLQARGNLSLFGASTTNVFLREAMDKYGVKAHVFRHGEYKNAPSIFTDKKYSKSHLETVQSMISSLNKTIREGIGRSRALNFDKVMWESVHEYGSLTSNNSAEIGLVDSTPPVDPLTSLLEVNSREEKEEQRKKNPKRLISRKDEDDIENKMDRKKLEDTFGLHESFGKFTATEAISIDKYGHMLKKKERIERTRRQINNTLHKWTEKSTATSMILSALGLQPDGALSKVDKVAVVTVNGTIGSSVSYEIVRSLRLIRKDKNVMTVVLRVESPGGSVTSSEAILEEIKLLDKPVICSMSNAAASGGYYISMNSEKIFAHPTTLTGSIGVFGVKFDASQWAKSYGIRGDYYPHGSHAAAMHPLTPLTPGMKQNISRMVLDYYDYFKNIVAKGRSLSIIDVEKVAQGRVWTGEQAKEVGLVDELGGLDRAISYAKKVHTKTEKVDVDYWPKRSFRLDDVPGLLGGRELSCADLLNNILAAVIGSWEGYVEPASVEQLVSKLMDLKVAEKPHFMLTMDEKTAMDIIMGGE